MFYKVVVAVWDIKPPPPQTHTDIKKRGGGGGMGIFLSFFNMFNSVFWAGGGGGGVSLKSNISVSQLGPRLSVYPSCYKKRRENNKKRR